MNSYQNYWQTRLPVKQEQPVFNQYHYDAKYKVEIGKFLGKLHLLFEQSLPQEAIDNIETAFIQYVSYRGVEKKYKGIIRRYLLSHDGIWHETPERGWVSIGYEVNDDTLQAFVTDIKTEYYLGGINE